MKTRVSNSLYPNDSDTTSLLDGIDYQYKWGGQLGTTTTLTYSFASQNTFELNKEYEDSLYAYYPEFFQSGLDGSIFDDPRYSFRTFNDLNKTSFYESLDTWSDATGINFVEVIETSDGDTYGDLRFFAQDFNNWASLDPFYQGVAGYAYLPFYDGFDDVLEGDVFLDTFPIPCGYSALEMMAKGKPVVVFKGKNLGDYAKVRLPELIFEDKDNLEKCIKKLAKNKFFYKQNSDSYKNIAIKLDRWEDLAKSIISI